MSRTSISKMYGSEDDPTSFWFVLVEEGGVTARRYITGTRKRAEDVAASMRRGIVEMERKVAEEVGEKGGPTPTPKNS